MRDLVVGGRAGAAWLLSGAAAQAADQADEPTGSLLGSLVGGGVTAPVIGLLHAAARWPEARPGHYRYDVAAGIFGFPHRARTLPVQAVSAVTNDTTGTTVDAVTDGVGAVPRGVAGPLRLTGGPAVAQQRLPAVTTQVISNAEPVDERPQQPADTPVEADSPPASSATFASEVPIVMALRARTAVVKTGVPARRLKAASATHAHRHPLLHRAAGPVSASEDPPGGKGLVPRQMHVGDISGSTR